MKVSMWEQQIKRVVPDSKNPLEQPIMEVEAMEMTPWKPIKDLIPLRREMDNFSNASSEWGR